MNGASKEMIAIIDYGMGNLASVAKAVEFSGGRPQITADPKIISRSKALIFPGVGAFGEAMKELRVRRLKEPIIGSIQEGKPFLGLCLGLQLLLESSEESPGVKGLGVLPGRVRKLPGGKGLKIPHMGWNQIERFPSSPRKRGSDSRVRENDILQGVPERAFMYFVHSFYGQPEEKRMIVATTWYGRSFPSILWNGRQLWATQFHPEKSQRWGLKILENFLRVVSTC